MGERNVQILAKEKIIPRAKRGSFDLFETAKAYIKHLKDQLGGKIIEPEQDDLKGRKLKAETEEREAKAALRHIELEEERGKLIRREDIERQWSARLIEFKAALLELPKRVSFRFADPDIKMHVEEEVSAFVAEILDKYSREGIVPDCAVGAESDAQDAPTAEVDDGERVGGRKPRAAAKGKPRAGAVANE